MEDIDDDDDDDAFLVVVDCFDDFLVIFLSCSSVLAAVDNEES